MEAIRQWALAVCVTLAGTAIFSFLFPNGNLKKVMRFAVGLFFLSSIFSPFLVNFSFEKEQASFSREYESAEETLAAVTREQTAALAEQKLCAAVSQLLLQIDVSPQKVEIKMDIDGQDSISISELAVTLDENDRARQAEITALLQKEVGCIPQLSYAK